MNGPTILHHVEDMIMRMFNDGDMIRLMQEEFSPDDIFESEQIAEWTGENLSPDDVFAVEVLQDWFVENNDVRDYIDVAEEATELYTPGELYGEDYLREYLNEMYYDDIMETALENIKDNSAPDEIFDDDELEEWARENGFVKLEECPEPEPSQEPGHVE